ncbi:hypothetical protein PR202_gb22061 [Eleusine coracana subsp. coracana]|uniref:Uncharacterized protein n=1 Tax=Eleusine coracana subsp. coracana TaxID=191504 RepID=A0AAV5FFL4_ELECO|nr:hypothetical protein PR202_gb22061 [Eleusine coracana subsp. coracana]
MEWSWNSVTPPSSFNGEDVIAHALHPDGRTLFVSTSYGTTHFFGTTSNGGVWKELGDWVLPFQGQGHFDAKLDAWVGLHHKEDGYVCCCPVVSRSVVTTRPPKCKMLQEKLFHRETQEEVPTPTHKHLNTTLVYKGDSRLCLVDNSMTRHDFKHAVLHVTIFGLKYDHRGHLQTKIRRTVTSYSVSNASAYFTHPAFWM